MGADLHNCLPPPGFKDIPHPVAAPLERLVSHTEEIIVDRPLAVVLHAVDKPLSETIKRSDSLPGVTGSYMLTEGPYGAPGSRQLNCLSDGSTLVEQVLLRKPWRSRRLSVPYAWRTGINQSGFGTARQWRLARVQDNPLAVPPATAALRS